MPAVVIDNLEDTITEDVEATSLPEEEAAPEEEVETEVENPYAGMSKEEIDALREQDRKDAEARARQSEKDKAEAAIKAAEEKQRREQFQRDMAEAQSLATGAAHRELAGALAGYMQAAHKAGMEGDDPPAPDVNWLNSVVSRFRAGIHAADTNDWVTTLNAELAEIAPQGWEAPRELVIRAAQTQQLYDKGGWLKAGLEIIRDAVKASVAEEVRKQVIEDERIKSLESKKGREPGPTGTGSGATPRRDPIEALNEPGISEEETKRRWALAYPDIPWSSVFKH
jgi:hypothetical protein